MREMPRSPLAVLAALAILAGCDGPSAADAGADAAVDAGRPACDGGPDPLGCERLSADPSCEARWIVGVRGRVVTSGGDPVAGARPQLCARVSAASGLVCLVPPASDASGEFTVVVPEDIRCLESAAMRVLAPGEPLATTYCPLDLGAGPGAVLELAEPYELAPVSPATERPARGDETEMRDVTLPGGVTLTLAPAGLTGDGYEELAGARVDVDPAPCFARDLALDGAYAFDPEGPVVAGAGVRVANEDGLLPGTVVDLYVLGGLDTRLIDGTFVDEAELVAFGTATVGADGAEIVSDPDVLLPYLSWLAWKAR